MICSVCLTVFWKPSPLPFWRRASARVGTTVRPIISRASLMPSDICARVVICVRSMPSCTIVCAIAGLTPVRMQRAPIRRAAVTVLMRWLATSVSIVRTPVMSRMAIVLPVSTTFCSRASIIIWARRESSVPMIGSVKILSQTLMTGVESSSMSARCWRMISSRERMQVAFEFFGEERADDVAQREDVGGVLHRRVALDGAHVGNLVQIRAQVVEGGVLEVAAGGVLHGLDEHVQYLPRLLAEVFFRDQLVAELVGFEPLLDPEVENLVAARGEQRLDAPLVGLR